MSRRRRPWAWILVIAFVVMPLLELYVLIQVGQVIGVGWALLLIVIDSVIGAWLVKREGIRAWRELTQTLQQGRSPHRELADGALVLLAGSLMLAPGFVTDAFGVILLLPFARPIARKVLSAFIARRIAQGGFGTAEGYVVGGFGPGGFGGSAGAPFGYSGDPRGRHTSPGTASGDVVEGKVVDD
ncbi:FxsA family protein [Nocardioides insulae]|uniref:FxsA family protein n=1 Tax=Nocardioides insulae TaxID=394734 RepID=UPI0003F65F70|nr:FxsA family protein [Nocardioides insulae]